MKWESSSLITGDPYAFTVKATKLKEHCLKESGICFADHRAFLQLDLNVERERHYAGRYDKSPWAETNRIKREEELG